MKSLKTFFFLVSLAAAVGADAQVPDYKAGDLFNEAAPESPEYRAAISKRLFELYNRSDISFVAMRSGPGQAASGVVLQRTADSISIDMTPCLPEKTVRYFVAPYRESSVSDERCGDKVHQRVQVIQLAPPRR